MRIERELLRRVEHSAAELATRQAHALARRSPATEAAAQPCDGGALVAFGHGRYVNRAIGIGLGGADATEITAALRAFYEPRSMAASLEASPWVDASLLDALRADGYQLERFRNVYVHPLTTLPEEPGVEIAEVNDHVSNDTAAERRAILANDAAPGSDARRISDEYCDAAADVDGALDLVALIGSAPAACGSLNIVDGIGWIGGAATRAEHRGKGLQQALVEYRLRAAHHGGCAIAAATALPDGQSARNLERFGFQLLYTQAVLTR